jgi:hypothetical protein
MLSEYPNAGQILRCLRDVLCHVLFLSKVSVAGMIQVMGSSRGVGIELVHHRAILDQLKIIQKVSFGAVFCCSCFARAGGANKFQLLL